MMAVRQNCPGTRRSARSPCHKSPRPRLCRRTAEESLGFSQLASRKLRTGLLRISICKCSRDTHIYICIYAYVYIYIYIYICVYKYKMCICVYTYGIHDNVYVCMHVCTHVRICMIYSIDTETDVGIDIDIDIGIDIDVGTGTNMDIGIDLDLWGSEQIAGDGPSASSKI